MRFLSVITLSIFSLTLSFSQGIITNTQTPTELVQDVLLGTGIVASNITFNGNAVNANTITNKIGYFEDGTSTFPITRGVVMSTGSILTLPGPGSSFSSSASGGGSDPDLATISGVNINDATVLEFDFVAIGDSMNFRYMFGSEEYPEFVNIGGGGVNDAFGFFISGPGISGPFTNGAANLAIIPNTTTYVSINTVNNILNNTYYTNNAANFYGTSFMLDGYTTVLIASRNLVCGATYHIKLAIGDGGDSVYDSAVFLEAESFSSNAVSIEAQSTVFGGGFTDTVLAESCTSTNLILIRPEWSTDTTQTFTITYSGTASQTADFTNLTSNVIFPIGVDSLVFNITPVADGINEPMEWIKIKGYTISVCGDTLYDSLTLYIVDKYPLTFDLIDTVTAACAPNQAQVQIYNFQGSIPNYDILWDFGDTTNPVLMPDNGSLPGIITYNVTVTDGCGNDFFDSVTVIYNVTLPNVALLPNDTIYVDCIPDSALASVILTTGAPGPFTYAWSNGSTNDSTYFFDSGTNGEVLPFSVTVTDGCSNQAVANGVLIVNQTLAVDTLISSPSNFCDPTGYVSGIITGQTSATGNILYSWSGPGAGNPTTVLSSVWINKPSGWYYFTATDDVCSVSDSVFIDIQNAPNAQMTAAPSTGTSPLWVQFNNSSTNASSYIWNFGNGETATTNDLSSVFSLYDTAGVYTVMLIASQGNNCNDTTYLTIVVNPPPVIPPVFPPSWEIPNVFSPNDDLVNDLWFIKTIHVDETELYIFNRWGNVMYEGKGPLPAWNGETKSGTPAEDGVYFYKFILYANDGTEIPGHGFLHLER